MDELAAVVEFERAWESSSQPDLSAYAVRVGFETLIKLIHIDLERRIRAGLPVGANSYFEEFPDVATPPHAIDLIVAEYRLRSGRLEPISAKEVVERFPEYRDQLLLRLAETDQLESESSASADTLTVLMPSVQTGGSEVTGFATQHLPQIPGYETERLIASGGMGAVYEARDTELNRVVAIKLPRDEVFADAEGRDRFLREARAAAGLRHPNICPIYQIGEVAGKPYITMGYVAGCTLKEVARRGLSPREAAAMVATLAGAVEYAHKHQVLHRDIKPANVLIDEVTGEPILTDFGLAKELSDPSSAVTRTGQIMGTPAYMAPEQAAGRASAASPAADVYSLGAVLFELLTGQPPLTGSVASILTQLQQDSVTSPRRHVPSLHRDLETICLKALAHQPTDRYVSAAALADDLNRFGRGDSILAKPDGLVTRTRRLVRRHPVSSLLLAMLVIGSATAAAAFIRANRLTTQLAALRTSVSSQTLILESATLDEVPGIVREVEADLRRFRQLSPTEAASRSRELNATLARLISDKARSRSLNDDEVRELRQLIQLLHARRDAASAGRLEQQLGNAIRGWVEILNSTTSGSDLFDLPTGSNQDGSPASSEIAEGGEDPVLLPAVTPTNVRFDVTFAAGWNTSTPPGVAFGVVDGHRARLECATFSPDGHLLASCDLVGTPRVWNLETMQLEHVVPVGLKCRGLEFSADGKRLLIDAESRGYALWDVEERKLIDSGERHAPAAISPDRSRFAFDTLDRTVTVKSLTDAATLQQFRYVGHGPISMLVFSEKNTLFVLDWTGRVSEWDPATGSELRVLYGGDSTQPMFWRDRFRQGSEYFPDQQILAAAWSDGTIRVWKTAASKAPLALRHPTQMRDFEVSADGRHILTTSGSGPVYLWEIETGRQISQLVLGTGGANHLRVLPTGTEFIASSSTGISRWTFDGKRQQRYVEHLTGQPFYTCHASTGRLIASDEQGRLHVTSMNQRPASAILGTRDYELRLESATEAGLFNAKLIRAGTTVHSGTVRLSSESALPLRLQRLDGHIQAWVDGDEGPPLLSFHEVFSVESDPTRRFAIILPTDTKVESVTAFERRQSKVPDVWQFADKYYAQGKFEIALDHLTAARNSFATTTTTAVRDRELWQEATYKSAACLLNLGRESEARELLNELSAEQGERWPAYAVTRLLTLALQSDDVERASLYLDQLQEAGWDFRRLVAAVPGHIRDELAQAAHRHFETAASWYSFDPKRVPQLQRRIQIELLTNGRPHDLSVLFLLRALRLESRDAEALALCREYSGAPDDLADADLIEDLAWILRENGETSAAINLLNRTSALRPEHQYQFSIELARADIAEGHLDRALQRCDETLRKLQGLDDPMLAVKCQLHLIRGFVLSDLNRPAEQTQAAWKEGFRLMFETPTGEPMLTGAASWTLFLLLGSLSGDLTPEALETRIGPMISQFTAGTSLGSTVQTFLAGDAFLNQAKLFSKSLFGTAAPPPQMTRRRRFAERMIAAWLTERGRKLARQIAYLQIDFPDLIRDPALLMACEIAGYMIRPQGLSDEQQKVLWKLAHEVYGELLVKKSEALRDAMPAIGLAWQANPASSDQVLTRLETLPDIQAPLAYFLGLRCLAENATAAARKCFIQAQKTGNAALVDLSQRELAMLSED